MKTRSIIIVVATLILGFILGMLTSAQIRHQKLKPFRVFFSDDRFREGIYSTINPDDAQKEKLEVIIKKYAKRNYDLQVNYRKDLDNFMKDLWKEMEPVLTAEQVEKLIEMEKRRYDFSRQGRSRPPGDSLRGNDDFRYRSRTPGDSARMRPPQTGDSLRMKEHSIKGDR